MYQLNNHEINAICGGNNILSATKDAISDGLDNGEIGMFLLGTTTGFIGGLVMHNPVVMGIAGVSAITATVYVAYDWYSDRHKQDNTVEVSIE